MTNRAARSAPFLTLGIVFVVLGLTGGRTAFLALGLVFVAIGAARTRR